jgi:uncharacterized protein YhhL (DUF1145 family)
MRCICHHFKLKANKLRQYDKIQVCQFGVLLILVVQKVTKEQIDWRRLELE